MALETRESNLRPSQHPRICRSVRLVTTPATLETYRRMLECERPTLFTMTTEATLLIRRKRLHHSGPETPVRIVAIHAGHGPFREAVLVGSLELIPSARMATGALNIHCRRFPLYQPHRTAAVNRMTRRAGDLALGVTALNPTHVSRLIQMAFEAGLIHLGWLQLGRIPDLIRRSRFGVLAAGSMAGFAGFAVPSTLLV